MTHHSLRLHAHRYATVRARQHQGFHAKPVYRPPLTLWVVGSLVGMCFWGGIWIAFWSLLP